MGSCRDFLLLKATGTIHSCLLGLPQMNNKLHISRSKIKPGLAAIHSKKKAFKVYSFYAWGFPFLIVAASTGTNAG